MNRTTMGESGDEPGNYVASNMHHIVLDMRYFVMIIYGNEDGGWLCQA